MLGFDKGSAMLALGTATCLVGLVGVGMAQGLANSAHVEERGLAAIEMDGPTRIVAMRADGAVRLVVDVAGAGASTVADVPMMVDEWIEGESAGEGKPWSSVTIHRHRPSPRPSVAQVR